MSTKLLTAAIIILTTLAVLTSPPLVRPFLAQTPPATAAPRIALTVTATPTDTPDPFAAIPTATPLSGGALIINVRALPSPALGDLPPTFTPVSLPAMTAAPTFLPPTLAPDDAPADRLPAPQPVANPPDRLQIPSLTLDATVVPVGLEPAPGPGAAARLPLPPGKTAGWLDSSAPFGQPGNTVLTGRHQAPALTLFHGLWLLEPGDEIILSAGDQRRRYAVDAVEVLSEQIPLDRQAAIAQALRPTDDERLTLLTAGPATDSAPHTIVTAMLNAER